MENTTNYANPNMGYTKKIKEYTNQITYTSFWKHTHTFYEIFIITHGEVTHYFNDIPKRLQTGDVVLMKANNTDYHYFKKATPVKPLYETSGATKNLQLEVFHGLHEFSLNDVGIDFLLGSEV